MEKSCCIRKKCIFVLINDNFVTYLSLVSCILTSSFGGRTPNMAILFINILFYFLIFCNPYASIFV